ncbi:MAG: PorT family protein [Rikenellaceae bacterium]|nr:PorT family protein [Rikenellaceae bacterium]
MKKLFVLVLVCLVVSGVSAQPLKIGVKGGLTFLSTDAVSKISTDNRIKSKDVGFTVGVVSRFTIPVIGIYAQPELVYNYAKYNVYRMDDARKLTYNNLELPVLFGLNLLFIRINAGPVFNLKTFDGKDNYFHVYRPNVGYIAGLGLSLGRFDFDVRWQGYFSKENRKFDLNYVNQGIKVNDKFITTSFTYFF